jgi:uncharacterized membrane protein (DUF373 family)
MSHALADSFQEKIKAGNTAHMLVSVFLILVTMLLEVIPVFLYFTREAKQSMFTQKTWMLIGGILFVLFLVNIFITLLSMHLGIKKTSRL